MVPAISLLFDYTLTASLSGGTETLLDLEYSPLVRFAVGHGLFIPYMLGMAGMYAVLAAVVLCSFRKTRWFRPALALIGTISLNHVLGGLSWVVRAPWYSTMVICLTVFAVAGAVVLCVRTLCQERSRKEEIIG
jgi:hypothetical protein